MARLRAHAVSLSLARPVVGRAAVVTGDVAHVHLVPAPGGAGVA
jgi:hypothetical protein